MVKKVSNQSCFIDKQTKRVFFKVKKKFLPDNKFFSGLLKMNSK